MPYDSYDPEDYETEPYSYTRDGNWKPIFKGNRKFLPMMPMVMVPVFGRDTWWTIEEARRHLPEETIQDRGKPFL